MASNNDSIPFLQRLAQELLAGEQSQWVVLPNRRSLFVLRDLLGETPLVQTITIDDLMQKLSGLQLMDPEELLVSFYGSYCQKEAEPQSFDEFASWAVTFLGDINDVDLHLGDVDQLYHHIHDFHATGESFNATDAGPIEKRFLSFWERLPRYYRTLQTTLESLKLGYRGRIYRAVAEKAIAGDATLLNDLKDQRIHWVGIVPGNPSERTFLEFLEDQGVDLHIYADIDRYYSWSKHHEAGRLFREYPLTTDVRWETDLLSKLHKDIEIHALPGLTVQVQRTREILDAIGKENWSKTVVVIPDSSFVLPFMQWFGDQKEHINITSGYPMRNTMIHRFVMSWMNLHAFAVDRGGQRYFYHKHLEEFLSYAVVQQWLSGSMDWNELRAELVEGNLRFVSLERLKKDMEGDIFGQQAFDMLFDWPEDANGIFQNLSSVLTEWASQAGALSIARIERKAIQTYIENLKLLLSQFNDLLPESDVRSLKRFVHRQIGYAKIYIEEPKNDALQVMGMLETRMIDFEHVIVLGASDDLLPGSPRDTTHIPFVHRVHFKLPSRKETEALIAYHFYRLITRAKTVHLLYDAIGDEMSSGEPSRYIVQLQEELLRIHPEVGWKKKGMSFKVQTADLEPLKIAKTDEILEDVKALFHRGLSPSAINNFINSPLEFYYYNVLGLREQDEVEEDIEASTFGSVVHEVIEDAYRPFEGKEVDSKALEDFLTQSDALVEKAFKDRFEEADTRAGRNLLKLEMAKDHVRRFIEFELDDMRANGPVKILYLEERLSTEIEIDGVSIRLKGFADRIDERNGKIRIVDYKSGLVRGNSLKYDPVRLPTDSDLAKSMQLAVYKFMYCTNHLLDDERVESCIFSMRNMKEGYLPLLASNKEGQTVKETLLEVLTTVVRDMMDPTQYFQHKADSTYTTF